MSDTKACNLTEDELLTLIGWHALRLNDRVDGKVDWDIERINYLNKRLKSFKEVELKSETTNSGWGAAQ